MPNSLSQTLSGSAIHKKRGLVTILLLMIFCNLSGQVHGNHDWVSFTGFVDGLAIAYKDSGFAVVNDKGEEVRNFHQQDRVVLLGDGFAVLNEIWPGVAWPEFYSAKGKLLSSRMDIYCKTDGDETRFSGKAIFLRVWSVGDTGYMGYVNGRGEDVLPPRYTNGYIVSPEILIGDCPAGGFDIHHHPGNKDTSGKHMDGEFVGYMGSGMILMRNAEKKTGVVSLSGEVIVPMIYDLIAYSEGVNAVAGIRGNTMDVLSPGSWDKRITIPVSSCRGEYCLMDFQKKVVIVNDSLIAFYGEAATFPRNYSEDSDFKKVTLLNLADRTLKVLDGQWKQLSVMSGNFQGPLIVEPSSDDSAGIHIYDSGLQRKFRSLKVQGIKYLAPDRFLIFSEGYYSVFDGNGKKISGDYEFAETPGYRPAYLCCIIRKESGFGLIDTDGRELLSPEWERIQQRTDPFGQAAWLVLESAEHKYGLANLKGKILLQPKYDEIPFQSGGFPFAVKQNGRYYFVNSRGKEIFSLPEGCKL